MSIYISKTCHIVVHKLFAHRQRVNGSSERKSYISYYCLDCSELSRIPGGDSYSLNPSISTFSRVVFILVPDWCIYYINF